MLAGKAGLAFAVKHYMFEFLRGLPGISGLGQPLMPDMGALRTAGNQFLGGAAGPQTGDAVTAESANAHAAAAQPDSFFGQLGQTIGDVGRGLSQEGLSGLLDPGGMMDRQQSQRDLSGRFEVLPDDFIGPRRQNQVSQEQYQDIARTFSDVRRGTGDLAVDSSGFDGANAGTESAEYRQGTMDMVANMMMTTGGRRQIGNLNHNVQVGDDGKSVLDASGDEQHRQTTIRPLFGIDNGTVDAEGNIVWQEPSAGNHTAGNLRSDNGFAAPLGGGSDRAADGTRGTGGDVDIIWNPGANDIGGQGARSDLILAHEMEHAINQSQGTQADGKFGGTNADGTPRTDATYRNAERQAVGLTRSDSGAGAGHFPGDPDGCSENTYRAERNGLGLGEQWLPREAYSGLPGQAGSQTEYDETWARHNASGNARP